MGWEWLKIRPFFILGKCLSSEISSKLSAFIYLCVTVAINNFQTGRMTGGDTEHCGRMVYTHYFGRSKV